MGIGHKLTEHRCADCGTSFVASAGNQNCCRSCGNARGEVQALARQFVNTAIKTGRLIRQACEICGTESAEAHHDDYGRPMLIRWLCRPHHKQFHSEAWRKSK
jgi:uncharacterized OB-fold protein